MGWRRLNASDLGPAFTSASTLLGVAKLGFPGQLVEVDLTAALPVPSREAAVDVPALCTRFRVGRSVVSTLSTVMRFDTALGGTVSDLRVELMFPADTASERWFVRAARRT